ncbi:WecB/TagA/CpsF family glycosyltransferase [Candidatus Parcubacteria bacterium]|nr:WecB/TagA/CpsF family glycosyltransferase [Candidatus Parcubacteria bacterium]
MVTLFGVRIDAIGQERLEQTLTHWLDQVSRHTIFTPNPEFLLTARKDRAFAELLNQSSLSLPDGIGLRFAASALGQERIEERVTGVDTLLLCARVCARKKKRLLLLGGADLVAERAALALKTQMADLEVVAMNPGELSGSFQTVAVSKTVWDNVRGHQPDVIAVALGQGKQERFCLDALEQVPTLHIAMAIGGALDMVSGRRARCPHWMRRSGFEWVWRVLIEPSRIRRIWRAVIVFPLTVAWDTLRFRRFWKAVRSVFHEIISVWTR